MTGDARAIANPPAWFGLRDLGDSSVKIEGRVWVPSNAHQIYKSEMTKLIKEAFDREGIEIPYPYTVELSKGEVERRDPPIKPGLDQSSARSS